MYQFLAETEKVLYNYFAKLFLKKPVRRSVSTVLGTAFKGNLVWRNE